MPVRFRTGRFWVVRPLFWYEVASATKAKTSDKSTYVRFKLNVSRDAAH